MTFHASRLLRKLKKAQKTEDGTIYIDGENLKARTQNLDEKSTVEVSLKRYKNSLIPTLRYLHNEGYIEYRTTFTALTSKGWHRIEEQFSAFCKFVFCSILTPIVVSVLTTLLTAWITGLLK